jgi:hypothetical protein
VENDELELDLKLLDTPNELDDLLLAELGTLNEAEDLLAELGILNELDDLLLNELEDLGALEGATDDLLEDELGIKEDDEELGRTLLAEEI